MLDPGLTIILPLRKVGSSYARFLFPIANGVMNIIELTAARTRQPVATVRFVRSRLFRETFCHQMVKDATVEDGIGSKNQLPLAGNFIIAWNVFGLRSRLDYPWSLPVLLNSRNPFIEMQKFIGIQAASTLLFILTTGYKIK